MAYASTTKFYHGFPTPGPQNPSVSDVMNHIFFASEHKWKECRESLEFDYVVIGSGFCGYAFVERLIKNHMEGAKAEGASRPAIPNILILERGSFFYPEHFQNLPVVFKNTTPDQKFKNETFPWTLSLAAATIDSSKNATPVDNVNKNGATWQHGMVPFFGGRSILWSAWCPRPSLEDSHYEVRKWPKPLVDKMTPKFFEDAEALLGVINTNDLALKYKNLPEHFRIYNSMQLGLYEMLHKGMDKIAGATRVLAAPLAVHDMDDFTSAFEKYSVVGPFLDLVYKYQLREGDKDYEAKAKLGQVVLVDNCVVDRILHQPIHEDGETACQPTALETSRGILPLGKNTKIIMAMGCMPPATLLLNSYPQEDIPHVGSKFAAHYISAITARIRKADFPFATELLKFEMAALYLSGISKDEVTGKALTYHGQISVLHDTDPEKYDPIALRYMPDVVSTASLQQLKGSEEYIVFVYALLGELDVDNRKNNFTLRRNNDGGADKTANCLLSYSLNDADIACWTLMEQAGFDSLEKVFAEGGKPIEYWNFNSQGWQDDRYALRVDGMVHESSVMPCGPRDGPMEERGAVGYDFAPYGTKNVYVTGSSIWPAGGSWNPTMTMCGFAQKLADQFTCKHEKEEAASHEHTFLDESKKHRKE